jgi:DNA-binding beta-propeller fold protein YncE
MIRFLAAYLSLWCGLPAHAEQPVKSAAKYLLLPGPQPSGAIQLPNQWSLRPAGKQLELGSFPVNLALHPSGRWLAVLHAGYGTHEVTLVNLERQRVTCRVPLDQTFLGLCFAPDGRTLFASGGEYEVVHAFDFDEGLLSNHRQIRVAEVNQKIVIGGLAVGRAGPTLFAAGTFGDAVAVVPLDAPEQRSLITLPKNSYPYGCLLDPDGKRLYVSLWSQAAIAVIDVERKQVQAHWATEAHPTETALAPDGKRLFVACANSTKVCVLDTATGRGQETIHCALYPQAPAGNTPNSLSLTPDGTLLFVANADANNLTIFHVGVPGQARPLGFIPTGWYPTAVRFNAADRKIYVANGKGLVSKANPGFTHRRPSLPPADRDYIAAILHGTLSIIDLPTPTRMAAYSQQAYACSPLHPDQGVTTPAPEGSPIPGKVGDPSPIKYCIDIIKENRTYDQIFGDMKQGNGDANLCLFPDKVTPNHHKLAREFVLLDNFYVDGEVSANGHEWSMGAYATDFVEKVWPLTYRGSPLKKLPGYPAEGQVDVIARPTAGYLWDRCAEAGLSYRSYGEWITDGKTPRDPGKATVKALEGHFDPWFRGFDLDYSDQKRADRFIEELGRFEKSGDMPRLIILRLPNDHTSGTRIGKLTPTALVADNDLALGRVVQAVSKSKFWSETAIFVVEDDAQDGPDHVDAHRTVALVVSPYTRQGIVDSTLYSTCSMLRTMELVLGLKPMSQFDAAARPMYASFQARPDGRPYEHVLPGVDREERNGPEAYGARLSEKLDLSKEDVADVALLNEIIWRSVRGANVPMPAPVRAAFVFPHLKESRDKDD